MSGTEIAFEDIRLGDKIRAHQDYESSGDSVEWSGVVTKAEFGVVATHRFHFSRSLVTGSQITFELLNRPKPPVRKLNVGDVVETVEEAEALPPGTLVRSNLLDHPVRPIYQRSANSGWFYGAEAREHNNAIGCTVVFLPPQEG